MVTINPLANLGNRKLKGMNDICNYTGFSESTILIWIRDRDFPAKKVGGSWISTTKQVDKWWEEYPELRY